MTFSVGALIAGALFVWQAYPKVEPAFDSLHEDYATDMQITALEQQQVLLSGNLEKTNNQLSLTIIQAQLRSLRDEYLKLLAFEEASGSTDYSTFRKQQILAEIALLEKQEACLVDPRLC